jgi:hypothetical protein
VVEPKIPDPARNEALAGYLIQAGWSPEGLGHHLNRLAASLRLPDRLHPKTPRRWVEAIGPKTRPSVPRDPWLGLVCTALSRRLREPVTLSDLGWQVPNRAVFVPADDGLECSWDAAGALASLREVVEGDGVDRRRFVIVTGSSLTTFAHDWLFDPARIAAAVQGKRINHAVAEDLEHLADIRRRQDDTLGCGAVLRPLREDLRMVIGILNNASYSEDVGQRLYGVAAELARIAGVQADDSGQQAVAQRLWLAGLRAAHISGDRSIGANILGFMTRQATELDPRDAIRLAGSALTGATALTPAMAANIHNRLATAAAKAGDTSTADRAYGRMFELTAEVDPAVEPPWIYYWSESTAHGGAGYGAVLLGRPHDAETHIRRVLADSDCLPQQRAFGLCDLAVARVQARELDGACRAATEAATLNRRLGSERVRGQLVEFRRTLQAHAAATPVKDFEAKFADLLRPAAPAH